MPSSSTARARLGPLGWLYGACAEQQRAWFDAVASRRRRLRRPLVSIGNLAVGGRGKTPLVRHVTALLREAGEHPAILSRGYARRKVEDGVVVVSDGRHVRADLDRAGDEPLMLARSLDGVAVLVSPDRHLSGRLAESRLGATVHVLDDGFQHHRLMRDVDLLLVTAADLQNGRVLPAGPLRERATGAARADAWITPPDDVAEVRDSAVALGVTRVFTAAGASGALTWAEPYGVPVEQAVRRVVAIAGIARPERFFDTVRRAGFEVAASRTWRDHHVFTAADTGLVARMMEQTKADLVVTTEKDAVRWLIGRPLPFPLAWLPWTLTAEPAGEFRDWLLGRIARARATHR